MFEKHFTDSPACSRRKGGLALFLIHLFPSLSPFFSLSSPHLFFSLVIHCPHFSSTQVFYPTLPLTVSPPSLHAPVTTTSALHHLYPPPCPSCASVSQEQTWQDTVQLGVWRLHLPPSLTQDWDSLPNLFISGHYCKGVWPGWHTYGRNGLKCSWDLRMHIETG